MISHESINGLQSGAFRLALVTGKRYLNNYPSYRLLLYHEQLELYHGTRDYLVLSIVELSPDRRMDLLNVAL